MNRSEICNMEYKFVLVASNVLMASNIEPMSSSKSRASFVAERIYIYIYIYDHPTAVVDIR